MSKGFREIIIAIGFFSCGALMYFPFSILVLEPLGFLEKHVSQIPEGPNYCVKITEERDRYC